MGLSEDTYGQAEDGPELGGMVQGKADVPQWSTQQSDILLRAHKSLAPGLRLQNPTGERQICHHSIAFADDTDQHTNVDSQRDDAIEAVVDKLQSSAQTWNNLINIPGGLLAYHKCNWQLMAWNGDSGHMDMIMETDQEIRISDGKGASARIDFLPPDKPNVGLGFHLCPNANQEPHFQHVISGIRAICTGLGSVHLTEHETRQLFSQRLIPKLTYALHLSSFTAAQCGQIDTIIRANIIPRLRLNRHFPAAVLHGPMELGGLDFPHCRTLQLITQLTYVIKQFRWNKGVANDMLVTLDMLQLASGLSQPVMEHTETPIVYVGPSFFVAIRSHLAEFGAALWIEDVWRPQRHRVNDAFLMDKFVLIPGITRSELRQANAVRMYMRIMTIADIAHPSGEFIPDGMLSGEWQAGSDIYWPHQVCPPPEFWAVFRRCLRQTFCTTTSPHQPIDNGMDLDVHLGDWLPVKRYAWFDAYRSETTIFLRENDVIYQMTPDAHRGYYSRGQTITNLPLDAHPIAVHKVGNRVWTHRPYRMCTPAATESDPAGYGIRDTITTVPSLLIVASDSSVHMDTGITTCAWIISASPDQSRAMCAHIQNVGSTTSYRGELEGIYRALLTTMNMRPNAVQMWCDNKAAIDKLNSNRVTLGGMSHAEADLLLAIRNLITCNDKQLTFHHVYGHQDSRPLQGSQRGGQQPLSIAARLNIECDRLANETATAVASQTTTLPTLQPPYPGSKAILRIGDTWITSNLKRCVTKAVHRGPLWQYCRRKYQWSEEVMTDILWKPLERARAGRTYHTRVKTSKMLHGWLPVMHMHGRVTGCLRCPGCNALDETFDHMLQCPNESMEETRISALNTVWRVGLEQGLPNGFMKCVVQYIEHAITGDNTRLDDDLAGTIRSQQRIGPLMFVRGFLSSEWLRLLRPMTNKPADRLLVRVIRIIWDRFIDPLWTTRNNILHRHDNYVSETLHAELGDRLQWYTQNKTELSRQDQHLADFTSAQIEAMSMRQRREWVRHLDIAKDAWAKERAILATGQTLITRFFKPRDNSE